VDPGVDGLLCGVQLRVTPEELYRLLAVRLDHDVAAREYLGLTAEAAAVIVTAATDDAALGELYGLASGEGPEALRDMGRFVSATGIGDAELRELAGLPGQQAVAAIELTADETALTGDLSIAWLDRAIRLVRLARACGLTLTETDLIVTTFAGGILDLGALRASAGVVRQAVPPRL
jgi:hypothetical protein